MDASMTDGEQTSEHGPELREVVSFIRGRKPDLGPIAEDADLIEDRIVDSLDFAELLFVIEEASGAPIDLTSVDLESFRSLGAIRRAFF